MQHFDKHRFFPEFFTSSNTFHNSECLHAFLTLCNIFLTYQCLISFRTSDNTFHEHRCFQLFVSYMKISKHFMMALSEQMSHTQICYTAVEQMSHITLDNVNVQLVPGARNWLSFLEARACLWSCTLYLESQLASLKIDENADVSTSNVGLKYLQSRASSSVFLNIELSQNF